VPAHGCCGSRGLPCIAAERAGTAIDDALDFIAVSNRRIAALVRRLKNE
jgi:hypothetical protein